MRFNRPEKGIAIEINPRHFVVAEVTGWDQQPLAVQEIREFARTDVEGLRQWLRDRNDRAFVPALVSFYPRGRILARDTIPLRRLAEPAYLIETLKTTFAIEDPSTWHAHLLHPADGTDLPPDGPPRPVLFSLHPHSETRETQQFLLDLKLMPMRLELGTLPLIATVDRFNQARQETRATVLIELEDQRTNVFILGKEGVQTPTPLAVGLNSILQAAQKELNLPDTAAAAELLRQGPAGFGERVTRVMRPLGRELRSIIGSFELTTGQRIGEAHVSFLDSQHAWLTGPLADAIGIEPLALDCASWPGTVGLSLREGLQLRPEWLGLMSILVEPRAAS